MGKKDFNDLYKRIKTELGDVTCKVSHYSDNFDPNYDYACMIVYAIDGKFKWMNTGGKAKGHRGRSFYIIIQRTNSWPEESRREAGRGLVHHYIIKNTLGFDYDQGVVCCGGFSYHEKKLKFSSAWLNRREQIGCSSDGAKHLSDSEKILVEYCFEEYKKHGRNHIFSIPDYIDRQLSK